MNNKLDIVHDIIQKTRSGLIRWSVNNHIDYVDFYRSQIIITNNKKIGLSFGKKNHNEFILKFIYKKKNQNGVESYKNLLTLESDSVYDLEFIYDSIKYQLRY